jgi:hypothetical protein
MQTPLFAWGLESSISFVPGGLLGNPAIVTDKTQTILFAGMSEGTNPTAGTLPSYNLVIGAASPNGDLLWYQTCPELLVLGSDQSEISLVVGVQNDLYVSFTTPGSTPGNYNMAGVPVFSPVINPGFLDVVVARINYTTTGASVAWVIQNARINSASDEYLSDLAIDTTTGLLYVVLETRGTINWFSPVGMPNLVLSCFSLNGVQLWVETQTSINSQGSNRNPAIAADNLGGVYLAFELTKQLDGGYILPTTPTQQVDMVKFQTILNPDQTLKSYTREWILSQVTQGTIYTQGGVSASPAITANNNQMFLTFLTTGSVHGNPHGAGLNELVICSLTPAGNPLWLRQGFDPAPPYQDAGSPYITSDNIGDVVVSLKAFSQRPQIGLETLLLYKLNAATGATIYLLPVAYTGEKTAVFPSAATGSYSKLVVTATNNYLTMALGTKIPLPGQTLTSSIFDFVVMKYNVFQAYPNTTPFQFMTQNKQICSCGAACSCSTA